MNDDFSKAGDVLNSLFGKIMPENAGDYVDLFSGWEAVVGSEIAMHVQPKDVVNGALVLETDHPGWTQRVRMSQGQILGELTTRYPELEIKKLKISLGQRSDKKASPPIVEKHAETEEKTPSVVSPVLQSEEDRKFHDLLEKMRGHGNS